MRNSAEDGGIANTAMSLEQFEDEFDEAMARVEAGETLVIERDGRPLVYVRPALETQR